MAIHPIVDSGTGGGTSGVYKPLCHFSTVYTDEGVGQRSHHRVRLWLLGNCCPYNPYDVWW